MKGMEGQEGGCAYVNFEKFDNHRRLSLNPKEWKIFTRFLETTSLGDTIGEAKGRVVWATNLRPKMSGISNRTRYPSPFNNSWIIMSKQLDNFKVGKVLFEHWRKIIYQDQVWHFDTKLCPTWTNSSKARMPFSLRWITSSTNMEQISVFFCWYLFSITYQVFLELEKCLIFLLKHSI